MSTARHYARRLLDSLELPGLELRGGRQHPAQVWAESGPMALTGHADGPPLMCPAPLASCADGVMLALAALAPESGASALRGARLLSERAAIAGLTRAGRTSPGGSCRLLAAADGRIALNLARPEDWELLPAWLESARPISGWRELENLLAEHAVRPLVERGRLMGLPVSADTFSAGAVPDWMTTVMRGERSDSVDRPRVLDLSALWAGPLCGHLLQQLGARVIKVESRARPDGARRGPPAFYDLLNAGKSSVALDFRTPAGRAALQALLARADIVIESARPRALRQLGVDAEAWIAEKPGRTWVGISAYGREPPMADWVGFGDDAGVAAGLSSLMETATGDAVICGDAIADPLTGMHAALAAWASHRQGGGRLLSLALRDVAAHCARFDTPDSAAELRGRQADWTRRASGPDCTLPEPRRPSESARPLGADTAAVLAESGIRHSTQQRQTHDLVYG